MKLEKMKFYIVIPQEAVNYVLNPIPYPKRTDGSFEGYTDINATLTYSDEHTRRAGVSMKITPATGVASGVEYSAVPITNDEYFVFSADVLGVDDQDYKIQITDSGGAVKASLSFKGTGYWDRKEISLKGTETKTDYKLRVVRDAVASVEPFWVSGLQYEEGERATTFFCGNTKGFGKAPLEYSWEGAPHQSRSFRSGETRSGGALLDIQDYARIITVTGLGMGNYKQVLSEMSLGGAYYQANLKKPRNFAFVLVYYGENPGELQRARNTLLEAINPDITPYTQPMVIRYQGEDKDGRAASHPLDIICVPQFSHQDTPSNPVYQRDVLSFTAIEGTLSGAYSEGLTIPMKTAKKVASTLLYLNPKGELSEDAGLNKSVNVMAQIPGTQRVVLGGTFENAGGYAGKSLICLWEDGKVLAQGSGLGAGAVRDLAFSTNGNTLYVGGGLTPYNHIVSTDPNTLSGFSTLGTGLSGGSCMALAIDDNAYYEEGETLLYVGGTFTSAGGVANTSRIAKWYQGSWHPLQTGLNGDVLAMAMGKDGNLYIGGEFTNATGSGGNYLCYWDGTNFNKLSDDELSSKVESIIIDDDGSIIVAGEFLLAGGVAKASRIARFANGRWYPIGNGVAPYFTGGRVLKGRKGNIYISALYAEYIDEDRNLDQSAMWNGEGWFSIGIHSFTSDPNLTAVYETPQRGALYGLSILPPAGRKYTVPAHGKGINSGNAITHPVIDLYHGTGMRFVKSHTSDKIIGMRGIYSSENIRIVLDPADFKIDTSNIERGRNFYKEIKKGSNLGDFYILPGENNFSGSAVSNFDYASMFVEWIPRFWGIEGAVYD